MRRSPCAANGRRGLCPSLSMRSDMVAKLDRGITTVVTVVA